MLRILLFTLLVAALALTPVGSVFAQDTAPIFCGDLSEDDCTLLNESRAAMENLTAGASDFQVAGRFEDLGGALDGDFTFGQATQFNVAPETLAEIQRVRDMDGAELDAFLADETAYSEFIVGLLGGLDLAQTIRISLSEELRSSISSIVGIDIPADLDISYVLKDGVIYADLNALADLIPSIGFLAGWTGVSVPDAIALFVENGTLVAPDDAADFHTGLLIPGLAYTGTGLLGDDQRSAMFDAHMAIMNDGMESIDGVETTRFVTELDFIELLADPDVQTWLIDIFGEELMASLGITKDNLGGMPFVLNMVGPAVFNELEYSIVQNIGVDDAYLYRNEVELSWDITRLARAFGRQVDDRVYVEFVTSNDNSEFNTAEVEAPGGALVLPLSLIMQLVEGMSQ